MRKAFTLIELTIYISLLVLLTTILLRTGLQTKVFSDFLGKSTDLILREHLLVDTLVRDLQSASCELRDWDFENKIFQKKWLDVGAVMFVVLKLQSSENAFTSPSVFSFACEMDRCRT